LKEVITYKEQTFLDGKICGNPGCGSLVPVKRMHHQLGFIFKIWQCFVCGWVCEERNVET